MEKQNEVFTIQFEKDTDVHLELIGEMDGAVIYRTIKTDYDLEREEKSKLTLLVEISPLSEQHKKRLLLHKQFHGKTIVSKETNTTEPTNGES
ncbi:MAG TPA: hypothetical protein VN026_12400 [Bacteroidia bacterium]|jgi:hypothetical protein|nr:hypothetical protein [Bacteroidia bacterium]